MSGSSTAGPNNNRTKRSIAQNTRRGIAPPPRAWSTETAARTPFGLCGQPVGEIRRPRAQTGEMPSSPVQ
eukprot:scaffold84628_cov18-Phaeocystis_antarctica.AAC.1